MDGNVEIPKDKTVKNTSTVPEKVKRENKTQESLTALNENIDEVESLFSLETYGRDMEFNPKDELWKDVMEKFKNAYGQTEINGNEISDKYIFGTNGYRNTMKPKFFNDLKDQYFAGWDGLSKEKIVLLKPMDLMTWAQSTQGHPKYIDANGHELVSDFYKGIFEKAGELSQQGLDVATDLITDGIESIKKTAIALVAQAEKTLQDAGEKVPDMKNSVQKKLDALNTMLASKNASSDQIEKANEDLSAEVQKLNAELNKPTQTKESSEKKKDEPTDTLTKTIFGGLLVGLLASLRKSFGGDSWLGNLFKEGARSLANWMGDELKDEQATSLGVRKITNKEGETEYVYALASDMLEDLEFSIETHRGYAEKLTLAELAILAGKKDVTPPQTSSLTEEQKKILTENCNEQLQDLYTITSAKTNPSNEYLQQTTVKEALEGESVVQDSFYAWLNKQPASAVAKNDKSGSSSGGTTGQTVTG